ncbi:DUF1566 domain-containing protein [Thiothrix lacustris]|uniref:Lcl domain-containing protein n=1 Tax=Thiothrix lacustris TaxID=525917 RepID=UPI0009FFC199|nr:DUF1566 domain-containing protein [Thiothrix lacustris]
MSIITFPIKSYNDELAVKKANVVATSILLSVLLGACSGNNGSSESASNTTGTTDAPVTASTGSTGLTSASGATAASTGTGSAVGVSGGVSTTGSGTGTIGTVSAVGVSGGVSTTGSGTGTTGTVSAVGVSGDVSNTGTTGMGSSDVGGGSANASTTGASLPPYFTKLADNGSTLPADASVWSCLLDARTGLIWEVKTDDGGLRDRDWLYRYNGSAGLSPAGTDYPCVGISACNPMSYIETLNAYGICGHTTWHLPTASDMAGIAEPHDTPPHINVIAFSVKTDVPYCIAKATSGHYQGVHFGLEVPAGADLQNALSIDMQDYDFECRVLSVSNQ